MPSADWLLEQILFSQTGNNSKVSPQPATAGDHVRRILLVDGMESWRVGLAQIIGAASSLTICAETGDYHHVTDLLKRHRPHLMIAEPFHHCQDGIIWIKDLARSFPQTKILVASSNAEPTFAERALRAGASGYWMKGGPAAELLEGVDMVLSGEPYVSPRIAWLAVRELINRPPKAPGHVAQLSDRELHMLALICAGHDVGRIAQELKISRTAVESDYKRIKVKFGYSDAKSLKQAAREFLL
jgi:DNA-binding NarL/FixJ family response regulator